MSDNTRFDSFDCSLQSSTISMLLSLLEKDQVMAVQPVGNSMFPFFSGPRDSLCIARAHFPLKVGDIALYQRANGMFVVHRVAAKKTLPGSKIAYVFLGDNQTLREFPVYEENIHGVVTSFCRKGKTISCESRRYRILSRFWLFLRPLRPVFLKTWSFFHRLKLRLFS